MTEQQVREEIAELCAMWSNRLREQAKEDKALFEATGRIQDAETFGAHSYGAIVAERIGQFALLGWELESELSEQ